jgi:UDP-glucose 4-epimerase
MSILVTGGTGFIGRYVVDRVQDRGEPVVAYDRAPAGTGLPAGVTSVQGELFDLPRLADTITACDVRGIVHAAGMSDSKLSLAMPAATVTANAIGTFQLLEAARLTGFGGRIVLLSSLAAHQPRTPFAATKAFGDLLGQVYTDSYALDVVSLRFSEAYGPGRRLPNLLDEVIDAAVARRPLPVDASVDEPYRLVHVEDAARAIVAALDADAPASRVYDIPGETVRLEQVVAIVRDRMPGADVQIDGVQMKDPKPAAPVAATAADRELGYRPRWGLARGIDDLCAWREADEAC